MVGLGVPGTQFSLSKKPIKTHSFRSDQDDQVSKAGETACLSLLSNLRFAAKLEGKSDVRLETKHRTQYKW